MALHYTSVSSLRQTLAIIMLHPYLLPMCGRFTYRLTWPEVVKLYRLALDRPARNMQPRYNICPTTPIDTVIEGDGRRELMPMRWGLVPSWWSKPLNELRAATFNARAETVADKPMFRDAFRRSRCLIPASGYYEWQDTAVGKQPYYFTPQWAADHIRGLMGFMA
jgi:putative SOS response-associated peptidase YedK